VGVMKGWSDRLVGSLELRAACAQGLAGVLAGKAKADLIAVQVRPNRT
jgi:hypothetical protein